MNHAIFFFRTPVILPVLRAGIFSVLIFLFMNSCSKEEFDFSRMTTPEWSPTWSAPLAHGALTLHDLIKDDTLNFIEEPGTHMLSFTFRDELFSQSAEQYMKLPDQDDIHVESNDLDILLLPGDSLAFESSDNFNFEPPQAGQRLDSLFIKSGSLTLQFISDINHNAKVSIAIPNVTKNGEIFRTSLEIGYTGTIPVTKTIAMDFSGYRIDLLNSPGHNNEMTVNSRVVVYGDNNPNLSPYHFAINCGLKSLRFSRIFGYLGQYSYPFSDSFNLDLSSNILQGSCQLKEIDLWVTTKNSIGMPLQIDFNELMAHSQNNAPHTVNIADPATGFPNPIVIASPDISNTGSTAESTFHFSDNNSNIIPAINMIPDYISYDISGKSNPGNNPDEENFIFDTSRFSVGIRVDVPLFAAISGFVIEDTLDFDLEIPDEAKMVEFKIRTINGFPLDAEIQAYFTDENYTILDSLISGQDQHLLVAAPVSGPPDYRVISDPPVSPFIFAPGPFTTDKLDRLKKARHLVIKASLSTYQSGFVKIYSDYQFDFRLAAKIQFEL